VGALTLAQPNDILLHPIMTIAAPNGFGLLEARPSATVADCAALGFAEHHGGSHGELEKAFSL
jgi:hypothetical protein